MTEFFMATYTAFLGYIIWLLKEQKKQRDANSEGTKCLLRVKLIEYHDKYIERGSIPSYAYENFKEMAKSYYGLNGNGLVPNMEKEVDALPLE